MSEARIALAPSSASASITGLTSSRRTMARTARHAGSASGATVGDSRPGVIAVALASSSTRAVVVEHQVLLGEHHALQPAGQLLGRRRHLAVHPGQQHRLGRADHVAEGDQAVLAQRSPGVDDVGDGVGEAELHRDLHRPVQPDHLRGDAVRGQVVAGQVRVGRGDPLAGEVGHVPIVIGRPGVAERGVAEAEADQFLRPARRNRRPGHAR